MAYKPADAPEQLKQHVSFSTHARWWVKRRSWLRFLAALPALLGFVLLAVAGIHNVRWTSKRAEANAVDLAQRSFTAGDYATARIAYLNLLAFGSGKPAEYLFRLSEILLKQNQPEESREILARLAPLDKPGYVPAQMLILTNLFELPRPTGAQVNEAEARLKAVLSVEPDNANAHELLGMLYTMLGRLELAQKQLQEAVGGRPGAALALARVMRAKGDERMLNTWAERAVRHYRALLKGSAAEQAAARLPLAESYVLLGRYEEAHEVLSDGWRLQKSRECLERVPEVCSAWYAAIQAGRAGPADKAPRVLALGADAMLENQLPVTPANISLLEQLVESAAKPGEVGLAARERVDRFQASESSRCQIEFCRGLAAVTRGDMTNALPAFERAHAINPEEPGVVNCLAMVLISMEPSDPDRALKLIQKLLEKYPDQPSFLDTRARIHLKAGRYHDAIRDFQATLLRVGPSRDIHLALATAYEKVGLKDLAGEHARLAAEQSTSGPLGK